MEESKQISSPAAARVFAAERMVEWGYSDAVALPGASPANLSVKASRGLARVIHLDTKRVSGRDILWFKNARHGRSEVDLLFFTTDGYEDSAIRNADTHKIALFTYDEFGNLKARNARAEALESRPRAAHSTFSSRIHPGNRTAIEKQLEVVEEELALWRSQTKKLLWGIPLSILVVIVLYAVLTHIPYMAWLGILIAFFEILWVIAGPVFLLAAMGGRSKAKHRIEELQY